MSGTPESEHVELRFDTPVNELDDHRFEPESPQARVDQSRPEYVLPAGQGRSPRRRTTRGSANGANGANSGFLSPRDALRQGISNRDFEQAVLDDDEDSDGEDQGERSNAASNTRRIRRRARQGDENPSRSRSSSDSDRSPSPPNSVEAFAEPRQQRGRSGTAESVARSFTTLHRRSSGAATAERPRNYSVDLTHDDDEASGSDKDPTENDVRFAPIEEASKPCNIDFDELDEFVMKQKHEISVPSPFGITSTPTTEEQRRRVYHNLCGKHAPDKEGRRRSSNAAVDSDSSDGDEKQLSNEKLAATKGMLEPVNRYCFFSSETEEMIHAAELGDLLMPGETFSHLFELGPEGGVWWLDMLMPSEEEVETICKAFGIHGLTREDIVQQETREKVELFKSYYFVCFRSFYQMDKTSDNYMDPVNVYAVVFREGILTFTFCPSPHTANVRKRMGKLRDFVSLGADWICYALIDDIVDSFGPVIREVEVESEAIEDNVFTSRPEDSRAILRQIGDCRKTVMSLLRLLGGKADVIKGFAKRCNDQYSIAPRQDVGLYLSDIQDHVVTMMSNLGHFEKMLSRSHANYLAQISVDSILQGNRANEVLSKVTFIATILVPLNLVCGMFGMNVPVPGGESGGSLGWWFGILGFLVLFVASAFGVAKRFKFI